MTVLLKRKISSVLLCLITSILSIKAITELQVVCEHRRSLQEQLRWSEAAKKRKGSRNRTNWQQFMNSISDQHFRRMFRMSRLCFQKLCDTIQHNVGKKIFCSEAFIKETLSSRPSKLASIFRAHEITSGGFVCGEVHVAITLRLLAGASYLDIGTFGKDAAIYWALSLI